MMDDSIQSMGGKARSEALSDDAKKQIARTAAAARWAAPKATHEGEIPLASKSISCAVLEDGTRLLTQQGVLLALGRARSAKGGQGASVDGMVPFLAANNLKPFISNELMASTTPIKFRTSSGTPAFGYKAEILPMVCEAYLEARDAKALLPSQFKIAVAADLIMRGLARVGISALIDEATGYQEVRDKAALQKILERFIKDEWAKWTRRFPPDYYRHLFRLKGIPFPPSNGKNKPSYVGHWTNDIVYSRLAPGVLKKLREVNPKTSSGHRARRHHQHLTEDVGVPELQQHLSNVIFLMKSCQTDAEFKQRLDIAAPKYGDTMCLALEPTT